MTHPACPWCLGLGYLWRCVLGREQEAERKPCHACQERDAVGEEIESQLDALRERFAAREAEAHARRQGRAP